MSPEQSCPGCGMDQGVWKGNGEQGVAKNGTTHCCEPCADGTGSECG